MGKTKIAWAEMVWNPTTGCTKVSQGCKFCYAERIANRTWATQYPPNEDSSPRKFTDVRLHPERLPAPLSWKKPSLVFVDSMSDLWHESIPLDFIWEVWKVMKAAYWHRFLILTKRPERMWEVLSRNTTENWGILPNVALGISAENQDTLNERAWYLQKTPAAIRFLSLEPLLEGVDFDSCYHTIPGGMGVFTYHPLTGISWENFNETPLSIPKIDMVIVGGESGEHSRLFDADWARNTYDQCREAGVKFFMKQLGGWPNKRDSMDDFPADLRIREYPESLSLTDVQRKLI